MNLKVSELDQHTQTSVRGGHALRKIKARCDDLYVLNLQYQQDINKSEKLITTLNSDRENLRVELYDKISKIGSFKNTTETELILQEEIKKKKKIEQENFFYKKQIKDLTTEAEKLNLKLNEIHLIRTQQDIVIQEQKIKVDSADAIQADQLFQIDELKVVVVKLTRRNETLEKTLAQLTEKNNYLTHMETTFQEENSQLQNKLKDMIEENAMITTNYQAIKRNHDLKRQEFEELTTELEEAKSACQLSIRHKRVIQNECQVVTKEKEEMIEKNKTLETILLKKEKDISELLTKVNDTINDYEMKLEKKEEQMWAMSLQMTEESQKQKHINIDPDFISDIEKKWQAKENILQVENKRLMHVNTQKDETIKNLNHRVQELTSKQFQPRMERLKEIENDIQEKMEEYCLGEERMETGFLCPKDLKIFQKPHTFYPCGHTYCLECVEHIKDENYDRLKCIVCDTPVTTMFRNEQLERLAEQFSQRKALTLGFLGWVKTFNSGEIAE
ncbi:hypothetical protein HDU92_006309 [Lobulomyces angularis]|nr:hypothetical protein HDU92_006309 [Lobulomyces angularis]